jgi:hypothetical protein
VQAAKKPQNSKRVHQAKGWGVAAPALLALIHRSAWNRSFPKFGCRILHSTGPIGGRGPSSGGDGVQCITWYVVGLDKDAGRRIGPGPALERERTRRVDEDKDVDDPLGVQRPRNGRDVAGCIREHQEGRGRDRRRDRQRELKPVDPQPGKDEGHPEKRDADPEHHHRRVADAP